MSRLLTRLHRLRVAEFSPRLAKSLAGREHPVATPGRKQSLRARNLLAMHIKVGASVPGVSSLFSDALL